MAKLLEMIQKLIADNTSEVEGVSTIDFEKIASAIDNEYVNPIVAKNKPDMDLLKSEALKTSTNDFIKGLKLEGVENVDGFNAYVKRLGAGTDETKEANSRMLSELNNANAQINELTSLNEGFQSQISGFEQASLIAQKGFNSKYVNAARTEASSRVGDNMDFESALSKVGEDYPEWLLKTDSGNQTPPPNGTPPSKKEQKQEGNSKSIFGWNR